MDGEQMETLSNMAEQVCQLCLCQARSLLTQSPVNVRDVCVLVHAAFELAHAYGIRIGPAKPLSELVDLTRYTPAQDDEAEGPSINPKPSEWFD